MMKKSIGDSKRLSVIVVSIGILAAGVTFMYKLYEFVAAASTGVLPGLISGTVLPYFFVSGGFLLLAGWAWAGGHYKDIEGPKRDMLRQEEAYEKIGDDKLFYEK